MQNVDAIVQRDAEQVCRTRGKSIPTKREICKRDRSLVYTCVCVFCLRVYVLHFWFVCRFSYCTKRSDGLTSNVRAKLYYCTLYKNTPARTYIYIYMYVYHTLIRFLSYLAPFLSSLSRPNRFVYKYSVNHMNNRAIAYKIYNICGAVRVSDDTWWRFR